MSETLYELKLLTGTTVDWTGTSGEDAARRFVDCVAGTTVIAWREAERYGVFVWGGAPILEPTGR